MYRSDYEFVYQLEQVAEFMLKFAIKYRDHAKYPHLIEVIDRLVDGVNAEVQVKCNNGVEGVCTIDAPEVNGLLEVYEAIMEVRDFLEMEVDLESENKNTEDD